MHRELPSRQIHIRLCPQDVTADFLPEAANSGDPREAPWNTTAQRPDIPRRPYRGDLPDLGSVPGYLDRQFLYPWRGWWRV
ncbi:hypothetical protein D3C75_1045110 [compost metagenome]